MDEAVKLIRHTQAENRAEFANKVSEQREQESQLQPAYEYQGKNADTGEGVIKSQGGDETVTGQVITSGSIKEGEQVCVGAAPGMVTINQMPSPKVNPQTTTPQKPKSRIKYLYLIAEKDKIILLVGGWKQDNVVVGELPKDAVITNSAITNLGNDDWLVDLIYYQASKPTIRKFQTFSSNEERNWEITAPSNDYFQAGDYIAGNTFFCTPVFEWFPIGAPIIGGDPGDPDSITRIIYSGSINYWFQTKHDKTTAQGGFEAYTVTSRYQEGDFVKSYTVQRHNTFDLMMLPSEDFDNPLIVTARDEIFISTNQGVSTSTLDYDFYFVTRINETGSTGLAVRESTGNGKQLLWLEESGVKAITLDDSTLSEQVGAPLDTVGFYQDVADDSFSYIYPYDFLKDQEGTEYQPSLPMEDRLIKVTRFHSDGSIAEELQENVYKVDQDVKSSSGIQFLGASYHA